MNETMHWFCGAVVIGVLAYPAVIHAEESPHSVSLGGGLPVIFDSYNDQQEIEPGKRGNPLENWGVSLAYHYQAREHLQFRARLSNQSTYIHGYNGPKCPRDDCSADDQNDNTLRLYALTFEGWANARFSDFAPGISNAWTIAAGIGVGPGYVTGLDDQAATLVTTAGLELGYTWGDREQWSVAVGPVVTILPLEPDLDQNQLTYRSLTPTARLAWRFQS